MRPTNPAHPAFKVGAAAPVRMVVEENTMDITPHPQHPLPRRHVDLQCTEMNIGASLDSCEGIKDDSDLNDGDFAQVSGDDTDLKEDARPPAQKKAKVTNP